MRARPFQVKMRQDLFPICQVLGSLGGDTASPGPGKVGSLYQGCF